MSTETDEDSRPPDQQHEEMRCGGGANFSEALLYGCGHPRYEHSGQGGRCTDGKQKDTAAWRCQCAGFVEPDDDRESR